MNQRIKITSIRLIKIVLSYDLCLLLTLSDPLSRWNYTLHELFAIVVNVENYLITILFLILLGQCIFYLFNRNGKSEFPFAYVLVAVLAWVNFCVVILKLLSLI